MKTNGLPLVVAVLGAAIFHITKIHPREIITTVSEVYACADNKGLPALEQKGDAFFLASCMCDKKRQIGSAVPVEVPSPHGRVETRGQLEIRAMRKRQPHLLGPRRKLNLRNNAVGG